jgi:hypothetical protein
LVAMAPARGRSRASRGVGCARGPAPRRRRRGRGRGPTPALASTELPSVLTTWMRRRADGDAVGGRMRRRADVMRWASSGGARRGGRWMQRSSCSLRRRHRLCAPLLAALGGAGAATVA